MGTKTERFEESTKIRSSDEMDELLRQARSRPVMLDDDGADEFEEHTKIGPVHELAAQSMTVPDDTPPAMPRASTKNVVRRTSSHVVARSSDVMPVVRAAGSLAEMTPPATDEDAFEPWDESAEPAEAAPPAPPARDSFAEPPALDAPPAIAASIAEPPAMLPVMRADAAPALRRGMRWGVVAWVVLLLTMVGTGSFAYLKIAALEDELAMTRSALEAAQVR